MAFPVRLACFLLFVPGCLPAWCQAGSQLPNAPRPQQHGSLPAFHRSYTGPGSPSKWYGVVDPGEQASPLTPRDKTLFWLHEEANAVQWTPTFLSAGYGQLTDGDPKYGSDSAAFGERLGAAALRGASMRLFSDSLLPAITGEDSRYFRKAFGSITDRGLYAASRVFIVQRDDGKTGFNYSVVLGQLIGASITPFYYPAPSVSGQVVVSTWLWSLAGAAGGNLFEEFWPDVRDKVFHHHRPAHLHAD